MASGKSLGISVTMLAFGIVLLAMAIIPSSAQEISSPTSLPKPTQSILDNLNAIPTCIKNIIECMATKSISEDGLTQDPTKCCSVIKTEVANATCFCKLEEVLKNMTSIAPSPSSFNVPKVTFSQVELEYNKLFEKCDIDTTFDELCNDVADMSGDSKSGDSKSGNSNTNGANKIVLAGLLPGAIFIWAFMMFL
ncbi:hypothetical protein SOVF_181490 [Spinacia oleracea]|nr:hypothetical protein SOVF_181490 [Spinacia oleracea]